MAEAGKIMSEAKERVQSSVNERMSERPREGRVTSMVERQTGRVPSIAYFNLGLASIALSAGVVIFARRKEFANFVGLWAPSFFLIGIYNKLVKIEDSLQERVSERRSA